VRKVPAPGGACKKDELDARWHDANASISAKCKDFVDKNYAHLIGADAVAGTKNLLVLLRGPRLGELAVIDAKTLAEHKAIKLPWCDAAPGGPPKASAAPAPAADRASSFAPAAAEKPTAAPARKAKAADPKKPEDPDAGGQ
jgi:hypothetical protein